MAVLHGWLYIDGLMETVWIDSSLEQIELLYPWTVIY